MYNIFSSYLHEKIFTLDTDKIKKDIFNNKSKNKGVVMSNHGGWQSKGNPTKIIKNKNIKSLFNKITMSVKEIEKKLEDNNILVSAHGNSIRALCKKLFNLDNNQISCLEIPTGNPLVIELSNSLKIIKCEYLDKERAKDLLVF